MRISDWSSDVCSSDLLLRCAVDGHHFAHLETEATLLSLNQIGGLVGAGVGRSGRDRMEHGLPDMGRLTIYEAYVKAQPLRRGARQLARKAESGHTATDDQDVFARAHRFHPSDQYGLAACRARVCQYV